MGILNHLFGGRKGLAKELIRDSKKRMRIFRRYLADYPKKEKKAKYFSPANIDNALKDPKGLKRVLREIEKMIHRELVDIESEEKVEKEIIHDLKELGSVESLGETLRWFRAVRDNLSLESKLNTLQENLLNIFRKLHRVLSIELHTLNLIKRNPANMRDLLLGLFRLINNAEANLYMAFSWEYYHNPESLDKVRRIAWAILLEEEIEQEEETDEKEFAREMLVKMGDAESEHEYRKLGEEIFLKLAERAGALLKGENDMGKLVEMMDKLSENDSILHRIIRELKPKYNDLMIKAVMLAFREAYEMRHFDDLVDEVKL